MQGVIIDGDRLGEGGAHGVGGKLGAVKAPLDLNAVIGAEQVLKDILGKEESDNERSDAVRD